MLGVDHDKNILLSTPFPTIPMLGTNCWCNVIMLYVGNKRCCIVLYCIVLYCIVLYKLYLIESVLSCKLVLISLGVNLNPEQNCVYLRSKSYYAFG